MNKKMIAIGAGIAMVLAIVTVSAAKATLGDKATELPGEEHAEKALHLQENSTTSQGSSGEPGGEAPSQESGESGGP